MGSWIWIKFATPSDIVLEGDSMIIHNALCERSPPPASVAVVIEGMQDLRKDFRRIEFTHVRQQGNRPTQLLAKHAFSIVDCIVGLKRSLAALSKLLSTYPWCTFLFKCSIKVWSSHQKNNNNNNRRIDL